MVQLKLTDVERQILYNQNKILAKLEPDNSQDYLNKAEIAKNGYECFYNKLLTIQPSSDLYTPEILTETHDILEMFEDIEKWIKDLKREGKKLLTKEEINKLRFQGFDLNNDLHYPIMRFLVNNLGDYQYFKGKDRNSHTAKSLINYRSMLKIYNENEKKLNVEVLKEMAKNIFL